jgi:hypothetical protein
VFGDGIADAIVLLRRRSLRGSSPWPNPGTTLR